MTTKKWLVHCARWLRERAKVTAWRDRSEKLAKQCAMAMANGREELGETSGARWKLETDGSRIYNFQQFKTVQGFCSSPGLNSQPPDQHQAPSCSCGKPVQELVNKFQSKGVTW